MTTLESRLEDYRQQIERLENERTKLWNTIMGKNRQIDELLERLETVAGRLQRCPQCLATEVKTEVKEDATVS